MISRSWCVVSDPRSLCSPHEPLSFYSPDGPTAYESFTTVLVIITRPDDHSHLVSFAPYYSYPRYTTQYRLLAVFVVPENPKFEATLIALNFAIVFIRTRPFILVKKEPSHGRESTVYPWRKMPRQYSQFTCTSNARIRPTPDLMKLDVIGIHASTSLYVHRYIRKLTTHALPCAGKLSCLLTLDYWHCILLQPRLEQYV